MSSKTSKDLEGFDVIVDPVSTNPPPVKDGGLRAWCTLIGATLTLTCTFGYVNAFGVYQDLYTREHAASASRISWIGGTQLFLLIGMGIVAGKLLDLGYFRQTTFVGSVIFTFSLFMLSLAHPDQFYQIFLSQGLGMGIGSGLLYVPVMAIQAHHWNKTPPSGHGDCHLSKSCAGSAIGGIFFPIMLDQLFHGETGYAWGVRASAFIVLALLALANVLMTTDPAMSAYQKPKPDIKGFLRDGPYILLILGYERSSHSCMMMLTVVPTRQVTSVSHGRVLSLYEFLYSTSRSGAKISLDFYLQLFAILHGVNPTFSFYTLAIMNGSSIPGRILPNIFANRLGGFNLLISSCVACSALIFALYGVDATGGTTAFAILYGFFSGAWLSLLSPAVASLSQDQGEIGVRLGLAFFLASPGALVGAPINGYLLGETFDWSKTILFSAIIILGGTALLLLARMLLARRKGTPFV
ncbi:hypothetical protein EWM64_g5208 [Hericium alpestre]|uniref:Major facilitator superfamily (MFS) profile domain-containing protein n=1 Tax=Hericium alpestre TaxID=135208 RepID=A0A4Y9ZX80_9AGAM|nr:hypothetical protein EWM64_g5208 [Hericium alpestre]